MLGHESSTDKEAQTLHPKKSTGPMCHNHTRPRGQVATTCILSVKQTTPWHSQTGVCRMFWAHSMELTDMFAPLPAELRIFVFGVTQKAAAFDWDDDCRGVTISV